MTPTTSARTEAAPGQQLPALWWVPGLNLRERLAAPRPPVPATAGAVEAWRADLAGLDVAGLAARLAALGVSENMAAALWHEPTERLGDRVARPEWADYTEQALPTASQTADAAPGAAWHRAFAAALRPLVRPAGARVVTAGRGITGPAALGPAELHAIRAEFELWLGEQLARRAARSLVRELHRARGAGELRGETGEERFTDFVRTLGSRSGLTQLFARYPVLARMLAGICLTAAEAMTELLDRYAQDRARLVRELLGGEDPGVLVRVELGLGDAHQGGRTVARLHFAAGRQVMYKPRPLDHHALWDTAVHWLNTKIPGLELRTAATVRGEGYGWMELVPHRSCDTVGEIDRFYGRQGALLALAHALNATDLHHENLVAHGDQPILVDAETLLHPELPQPGAAGNDPAATALATSVYQTCVLPQLLVGEHGAQDISAVGGSPDGELPSGAVVWEDAGTETMRRVVRPAPCPDSQNRPRLRGQEIGHTDYQAALLHGFQDGYAAIWQNQDELLAPGGPLASVGLTRCRLVARATRLYATVLEEATHPAVLTDALRREGVFALLWTEAEDDPARLRLAEAEAADLWAGDLPVFFHHPAGTAVRTAAGGELPGLLTEPVLNVVTAKIGAMSEVDRHLQEWIITAALATADTARAGTGPRYRAAPAPAVMASAAVPTPTTLLAAACGVADEIVARALHGSGRANWLGLEPLDDTHWTVLPMGAGLAQGYPGVALFLAQLGRLTGVSRYTELARAAIRPLPALVQAMADSPQLSRTVGPGAFEGLGGICYAIARLETLLGEEQAGALPAALAALATAVDPAQQAVPRGLADGLSGALAASLAVHRERGTSAAAALADTLADRLLSLSGPAAAEAAPGFARGAAGTAWALLRYADGPDHPAHRAGLRLLRSAYRELASFRADLSWCSGLSGVVLASADGLGGEAQLAPGLRLEQAVQQLRDHPPIGDLSLCHGESGPLEALTVLEAQGHPAAADELARRRGLALGTLRRHGHRCGTPRRVPGPGLLNGLAGVGYGLLRLGFAEDVPSVLLLHPTPPGGADGR